MSCRVTFEIPVACAADAAALAFASLVEAWNRALRERDEQEARWQERDADVWHLANLVVNAPAEAVQLVSGHPSFDRALYDHLQEEAYEALHDFEEDEQVEEPDGSIHLETVEVDGNDVTTGVSATRWRALSPAELPPRFGQAAAAVLGALGGGVEKAAVRELTHYHLGVDIDGGMTWRAAGDIRCGRLVLAVVVEVSLLDGESGVAEQAPLSVSLVPRTVEAGCELRSA